MKKIVTVLGARPQFVKAAVLSRIINLHSEIEEVIVHTGQHYDSNMSKVFFSEMEIPEPKYNLDINNLSHGAMTGQMIEKIEKVLQLEKPNAVVVYGDTNSTLAAALAAKKLHIKLIHIEAGLRSYNMDMPEEINRILTDRISDLLCCPSDKSIKTLHEEGFDNFDLKYVKTGDIMKDAVQFYGAYSADKTNIIENLDLSATDFILATIHRQENTDSTEAIEAIFKALDEINLSTKVLMPLHPRTRKKMEANNIQSNITFIDPVGYFEMLELLKKCKLVITDSGGLQKEAYYNNKHCVIVRKETEWTELVSEGFSMLAGNNYDKILDAYNMLIKKQSDFGQNIYGDNVGQTIYNEIIRLLN